MPLIKPGPGERWCPCCERLFISTPNVKKSTFCARPDCLPRQEGWERARHAALEGCPDCGGRHGHHDEGVCRRGILEKIGLPNGPCPWCGRPPGNHKGDCQLRRWHNQLDCLICGRALNPALPSSDPDAITRDHHVPQVIGGENSLDNYRLAHHRCNWWKGSGDTSMTQPIWGVRPRVPKSERRPEPALRLPPKVG
jgi:hypothetical protein